MAPPEQMLAAAAAGGPAIESFQGTLTVAGHGLEIGGEIE
jgi:hypothetical protein